MATTTIKLKRPDTGEETNLMFMTNIAENNIILVNVYMTDDNYNPVGTASVSVAQFPSEEEYHKDLRKEADKRGQLVRDYCTDPEWNPGYVEPEENHHEFPGDMCEQ